MARKKFMPSAPNQLLWAGALIIGFLGILGHYTSIDILSQYSYEFLLIGFILLVVGTTLRGI